MKKKVMSVFLFVLLALGIFWGFSTLHKSKESIDAYKRDQQLVLNDEAMTNAKFFVILHDRPFINLEFVKEKLLVDFRYSASKKRILFKVDQNHMSYEVSSVEHYLRNSGFEVNLPLLFLEEGEFVELEALGRLFDLQTVYFEDAGRLVIDTRDFQHYTGRVEKELTPLKMTSILSGPTVEKLPTYSLVRIFKETSTAFKVRLENGLVGYVDKGAINLIEAVKPGPKWQIPKAAGFKKYFKIGLAWDVIEGYADNFEKTPVNRELGLDVLSPTWFKLTNDGWVLNDADLGYTKASDALGYKVWPLFSNDFDPELTHSLLNSEKLRRKVVAQLIQYAGVYGFSGINLDFENVYLADREMMTQFVKELSKELHKIGLVLSVDVTVPWGSDQWSKFMDRKAIEPFCDYFMLMAYDEHWASSPLAGSVASLPWVTRGVAESLKLIPREKLILGLPLYMRVWTEETENGKIQVRSKTLSIKNMDSVLREYWHLKTWDPAVGQSTIFYEESGLMKKVWLEDAESLELKLQLVREYDLAGAAVWRKGFESPWFWELLEKMLKR